MIVMANVILATQIPYVMVAILCLLVLPIEVAVVYLLLQRSMIFRSVLGIVILGNVLSTLAGYLLAFLIPVPLGFRMHETEPAYAFSVLFGFFPAFLLSWVIEVKIAVRFFRCVPKKIVWRAIGWANAASYTVVIAVTYLWR